MLWLKDLPLTRTELRSAPVHQQGCFLPHSQGSNWLQLRWHFGLTTNQATLDWVPFNPDSFAENDYLSFAAPTVLLLPLAVRSHSPDTTHGFRSCFAAVLLTGHFLAFAKGAVFPSGNWLVSLQTFGLSPVAAGAITK
jgi:hypothetical protein